MLGLLCGSKVVVTGGSWTIIGEATLESTASFDVCPQIETRLVVWSNISGGCQRISVGNNARLELKATSPATVKPGIDIGSGGLMVQAAGVATYMGSVSALGAFLIRGGSSAYFTSPVVCGGLISISGASNVSLQQNLTGRGQTFLSNGSHLELRGSSAPTKWGPSVTVVGSSLRVFVAASSGV